MVCLTDYRTTPVNIVQLCTRLVWYWTGFIKKVITWWWCGVVWFIFPIIEPLQVVLLCSTLFKSGLWQKHVTWFCTWTILDHIVIVVSIDIHRNPAVLVDIQILSDLVPVKVTSQPGASAWDQLDQNCQKCGKLF